MQSKFFYKTDQKKLSHLPKQPKVDIRELEYLVARFIGQDKAKDCFREFNQKNKNRKHKSYNESVYYCMQKNTLAKCLWVSASAKLVISFAMGRTRYSVRPSR